MLSKSLSIATVFLVVCLTGCVSDSVCNRYTGPSGRTNCIYLRQSYTGYQKGTCVSDKEMREYSNGRHHCPTGITYCYYQCMLEKFSKSYGTVYDECKCGATDPPTEMYTTSSPTVDRVCDRYRGPSGVIGCINLSQFYTGYQKATCISDQQLRANTNGRHHCRTGPGTYCYYQCMLEKYGRDFGSVYEACKCGSSITSPTRTGSRGAVGVGKMNVVFLLLLPVFAILMSP